jgi:hypothetical protein
MWDSIPTQMKYDNDCWQSDKSAKECYMLLVIYLEHLYSIFLLHRILAKYSTDSSDLYDSAWQLLSATLTLCRERDRLIKIQYQLSWTIVYNGLPSAGLLALELLRKQQQTTSYQSCLLIPRAELIRSLSVFIDALDWVARPGHGNHALCIAARGVLTQILDAVLDPQGYNGGGNGPASMQLANRNVGEQLEIGSAVEDSVMGEIDFSDFSERLLMMEAGIPRYIMETDPSCGLC